MNQYSIFGSPLDEEYFNENPDAALYSLFPNAGGVSPLSEFLRGSLGRLQSSYKSVLPNNPNQTFRNFLQGQDLRGQFQGLAPSQRGVMKTPGIQWRNRW